MIEEDDTVQDLTKEQQDTLINKLGEHRELKTKGVRANNIAAARDMTATSDAIIKEVNSRKILARPCTHIHFFLV